jgi:hypothetical protein
MNTKSVVAKPRVAPKVVKAAKAAKAVVKKPKAVPKAAKAVVKKPRAAKAAKVVPKVAKVVVKKPKVAKAVVKKSLSGSIRSRSDGGYFFSRRSNAVVDEDVLQYPNPSILLEKILEDFKGKHISTVYNLIELINNMAENLNIFFEDFLHFYPEIRFEYTGVYNKKGLLIYQQYHLDTLSMIVKYVKKIKYYPTFILPYYNRPIYSGILDGNQKDKKKYSEGNFKFFDSYKLEDLPEHIIKKLKTTIFTYRKFINYTTYYDPSSSFENINRNLILILTHFFEHIQLMEINTDMSLDEERNKILQAYIDKVKSTAQPLLEECNKMYTYFNVSVQK